VITLPPSVHSLSCSLHPAFALRGFPQFLPHIYTSIGRAVYWSRSPDPPRRAYDLTLLDDQKKLTEVCCGASPGDVIAVDVETPEGKPTHIDICSLAWSSTEGLCFTWNLTNQSIVRSLLENPSVIKVGHNFGYDIRAFEAQGIRVQGPCMDTMDMCSLLWPQPTTKTEGGAGFPWHSLSTCALRVIEDFAYWKRPDTPATRAFYRAAFPRVDGWKHARLYCTLDSLVTKRLFHVTREMLKLQEMWGLYTSIVMPASAVLLQMSSRGIMVDTERLALRRAEAEASLATLSSFIKAEGQAYWEQRLAPLRKDMGLTPSRCPDHPGYLGKVKREKCSGCQQAYFANRPIWEAEKAIKRLGEDFDHTKPDQMRWLLFSPECLNLEAVTLTEKSNQAKLDKKVLAALAEKNPDVKILQAYAKAKTLATQLSTFLNPKIEEGADGLPCVHFNFSQHRSGLGRLSCGSEGDEEGKQSKSYNAQNIPEVCRDIYCARPGYLLAVPDSSQIEARIMAWLAGEDRMLAAWDRGEDVHSLGAAAVFGCRPEDARRFMVTFGGQSVSARSAFKRGRHGLNYGMGVRRFAREFGISEREASDFIKADQKAWPELEAYRRAQREEFKKVGYLVNPFGRRHYYFKAPSDMAAFVPQSTAADMSRVALIELDKLREPWDIHVLLQIHDGFPMEIPESNVEGSLQRIRDVLERPWPEMGEHPKWGLFSVPVEIKVGRNWGPYGPTNEGGLECLS